MCRFESAYVAMQKIRLPTLVANHLMLEEEPAWSLFLEELGLFLNS
jgi:hypothetical protein